jgi:membrane protease YdiL (CAAX protease family)
MSTTTRWRAVLSPLGRIVLAVLLVGGAVYAAELAVKVLEGVLSLGGALPALYYLAYLLAGVLVAYFVYRAYARLVERRALTELSGTGAPKELGAGMLVGFALVAAIVGVLWLLGYYRVAGAGAWRAIFAAFRGVVFRISEEKLGTWIALAISASLFALLHLTSPHATVTSVIVVGLEGGVLPSAAYVLTRRLWLAIGIHFAWDFAQDYVFGLTNGGLLRGDLSGPALLSGGSNGIEGSILALGLCLAVSAYLLVRATHRGHLVRPFWRRVPLLAGPGRGVRTGSVAP